jgi:selenocysteine lyase/cysteine desulfurase
MILPDAARLPAVGRSRPLRRLMVKRLLTHDNHVLDHVESGPRIPGLHREAGSAWTDAVIDAIDSTTAVVAVPSCHWTDGSIVDLERVGRAARTVGAAFVVDASQSSGAYPLDITQIQPDFLVTVGYKWLLGPYGLGYLYAAPRWRESGAPIEWSWLARAGSEDFSRLTEYTETYRAGARRFDMGECPRFVLIPMAVAALEQILAWGVDRIQAALLPLTSFAADGPLSWAGPLCRPRTAWDTWSESVSRRAFHAR